MGAVVHLRAGHTPNTPAVTIRTGSYEQGMRIDIEDNDGGGKPSVLAVTAVCA